MESKRKAKPVYSAEFKAGVVKMVLEEGRIAEQVRKELGIGSSTISEWLKQAREQNKDSSASLLTKNEQQELAQLRKENRILKMEKEILKKATAFFVKEQS